MSQELAIVTSAPKTPASSWADWAGMTASVGCAIHCAAMPLVLAYLPTFGLGWLADEGFHRWMAIFCCVLAVAAFVPGWRSHRSWTPLAWGAVGLILLNTAAFGLEGGCCPSCDAATVACADEGCTACVAEAPTMEASPPVAASFVPFMTPLGGVLLVVGHLINHRKRCCCQGDNCCLDTDTDATTAGKLASH